ncbi:DUF2306 domain-containing protein [Kitasatospora sp. NPDC088391]|uniref:DUF2306 domain-containing protein n=1 Tax=Kitasatospora sp. NPDC088391 TaxID=3364074 RepID=UPI0037F1B178
MTHHHTAVPRPGGLRRAGRIAVPTLALLVSLFSLRYFALDPDYYIDDQRLVYAAHLAPLLLHIGGAVVALSIGPLQFLPGLRARRPAVHRWTGRVYAVSALALSLGGLVLARYAMHPPVAPIGFAVLAVLVLVTTGLGVREARRGRIARHRRWMLRSYALIFAAVTLRIWLPLGAVLGVSDALTYESAAWGSWLVNLAFVEWRMRRTPNAA